MEEKDGVERALDIRRCGPPHAFIFPNLFLAEGIVTFIQPVARVLERPSGEGACALYRCRPRDQA
jgi:hypothetical protein